MDDKVKAVLEKVKITASAAAEIGAKAADQAGRKAGELMEIGKLKLKLFDLSAEVEMLYKEIGKAVYLTHTGAQVPESDIEKKLADIDERYVRMAELKEELSARKTTVTCPVCGRECDKGDVFCRVCGKEL
ncbi:MAG: zinc ribbon domain-containing protein [Clostridiaceae bacterium]|nr:zinc ribbon domain-containing protein [Clostridiaceae bacterium]